MIGDPLEFIASGPCLPAAGTAGRGRGHPRAIRGDRRRHRASSSCGALEADLRRPASRPIAGRRSRRPASWTTPAGCRVDHLLLGSNATAVDAAAAAAATARLCRVTSDHAVAGAAETADEVGHRLAREGLRARGAGHCGRRPAAGDHRRGRGGRAAACATMAAAAATSRPAAAALVEVIAIGAAGRRGCLVASIGTDGEDGPTTAAGGLADAAVAAADQGARTSTRHRRRPLRCPSAARKRPAA